MSELMAMMTASSPPLDFVSGSAKSKITGSDVAACLTHVDRYTYMYGLVKFALDPYAIPELRVRAVKNAREHDFELSSSESNRVPDLLGLTALRFSVGSSRCKKCRGVGDFKVNNEFFECSRCGGNGSSMISIKKLQNILGVSEWRARKVWQRRLSILLSQYSVMDNDISQAIHLGLRE